MTASNTKITVIKQDPTGVETWRYPGEVLEQSDARIVIEAFFDRDDFDFHGIRLRRGDRFIETYFTNRWYNIFEIYDVEDQSLKGWYCNIATPVIIAGDEISYNDLALDLIVLPDGRQFVLDEDEFQALNLPPNMATKAKEALRDVQERFAVRWTPENYRKVAGIWKV